MKSKKIMAALCALAVVVSSSGGLPFSGLRLFDTAVTASAADEVSENISLVASDSSNLKTISGTHYSVSCGYMTASESGMQVCKSGAMTINARKGETITKVVLTYNWGNNKSSLSASAGPFDGNATISDINAQQVTISSSNTAGVKISAVRVYFEGSLSNPTVTLTGGANAKSSGGLLTQSYLPGAMDTVTYTALTGAAFPEFETFTQNGVTVERTSDTVVTISGTPTANTAIIVPDAVSSSKIVTWNSTTISSISSSITKDYTYTANGITLNKTGKGKFANNYIRGYDSTASFEFTTATGKFTNIEIAASAIYSGGNWTTVGNTLKWNGTPSNSVSLSGSGLYLEGVSSINFVIEMPADLSNATVTLGADNTVSSVTVGGNEITDLSEFDITYGTDESHTATEPPTEEGTYYAYVTAKTESENYTGTAKSAAFMVAATAPTYTITIPESVNIDGGTAQFKAENVTLPDGAKINITVDGENTESGQTTFNAKNESKDSTVQYTIKNGDATIADGGTALTFTEGGTQTLKFTKTSEPTYAGTHTETLTFGVAVEDAAKYNVHVSASYSVDSMFEGEPDQIGLTGAMEPVTVRIPDDYKTIFRFNKFDDIVQNGITKHWVDDYTVTVSGTPTADTNVFVRLDMID